ncbi:MAG: hypothetical protein KGO92_01315 [Bacteroidota bacterium]|nr:hypothetical protein [Bacteroidota bacterium]
MQAILANYFITYGYLTIFCVILLQEMGMPGLPNELVLFYFGYLSRKAEFSYVLVIGLVVLADISGSFILYCIFYYGREWILLIKPAWLPIPVKKIHSIKQKIASQKGRSIFIAKLTPFVRSYIPVVAGLLHIERALYARIIFFTACIWSGGWITAGWLLHL